MIDAKVSFLFWALVIVQAASSSNPSIVITDGSTKNFMAISDNLYRRISYNNNGDLDEIVGRAYDRKNDKFYALPHAITGVAAAMNEEYLPEGSSYYDDDASQSVGLHDDAEDHGFHVEDSDEEDKFQKEDVLEQRSIKKKNNFVEGQKHPPQFHTVSIEYQKVQLEKATILKNENGIEYSAGDFNPIAIAYEQNALYIAHQAGNNSITNDGIFVYNLDGVKQREIALPLVNDGDLVGITVGGYDGSMLFAYFQINASNIYEIVPIDVFTGGIEERIFYEAETSNVNKNRMAILALDNDEGMLALEFAGDEYPYTANIYHISFTEEELVGERRHRYRGLRLVDSEDNQTKHSYMKERLHSGNQNWYEVVIMSNCNHSRNVGINRIFIFVIMVMMIGVLILLREA